MAHLVVMQRPGHMPPDDAQLQAFTLQHQAEQKNQLRESAAGRVVFLPVTQLEISASDIRRRLRQGASARYLLPEPVLKIIAKDNLYR